jgi:hypothetical protein
MGRDPLGKVPEQGRSSFLKKRSKKLLPFAADSPAAYAKGKKFFGSFFQKRTATLSSPGKPAPLPETAALLHPPHIPSPPAKSPPPAPHTSSQISA